MTPAQHTLAYLVAALAFSGPTIGTVKYSLQFLKGFLPVPTEEPNHSNITRIYAVAIGTAVLPALSAAAAYTGVALQYDPHEIPVDAVVGAASGFAAVLSYHALDWLKAKAASGSVQGLPFFGPAQSSGPNPQQTAPGSSALVQQSNSVPEPGPPPIVP